MFENYFKIAFRNIKNSKGYSFIKILGLAIGMACCMFSCYGCKMKFKRYITIVILGVFLCHIPLAAVIMPEYQNRKDRRKWNDQFGSKALKSDFIQMRTALEKMHPALYRFTKKEQFDILFQEAYRSLEQPKTLLEFNKIISAIFAQIGCGHSIVVVPKDFRKNSPERFFPLDIRFLGYRAYVYGNVHPESKIPLGAEILSINGKSMWEITRNLTKIMSSDGNRMPNKIYQLNSKFVVYYMFYHYFPEEYHVSYLEPGKEIPQSVSIRSVNRGDLSTYRKGRKKVQTSTDDPTLNLEMEDRMETAIITIKSFGFYGDRNKEFFRFIDDAFLEIKEKGMKTLIVDLRGNSGGDPYCANYLLSYLAKKSFKYFDKKYEGYGILNQPTTISKNHFSGKLYILIDEGGFSTTGHLGALLRYHKIGTLVGAETGASYECNDNTKTVKLENTGLQLYIPTQTYTVAVKGMSMGKGIIPDIPVKINVSDLLKKEDSIKKLLFDLIKKNKR